MGFTTDFTSIELTNCKKFIFVVAYSYLTEAIVHADTFTLTTSQLVIALTA